MWNEFKQFISRGNVLDLAVAVVIGGAFGAIVNSLVNDILMPIIGVIIGGLDFTGLAITVGDARIQYGNFIQAIVNFLIIAAALFFVVKSANAMMRQKQETPAPPPPPAPEVQLLSEIRDLLREQSMK